MVVFSKSVVIISHTHPDGDAIGSMLGIYGACKSIDIDSTMILPDEYPAYYNFLPEIDKIMIASNMEAKAKDIIQNADLLICTDFNSFLRVNSLADFLKNSNAKKVLIDHHLNPDTEAFDLVFSDNTASSASELAYWILSGAFGWGAIDRKCASALYTGICTDTGSFSYSINSNSVHATVAQLIKRDIDVNEIHNNIYQSYSINRIKLLGYCLNNCLKIFPELKMAYFAISKKEMDMFNAEKGDLEGVVNYTLMMKDIEVGALVKEGTDGKVRISFRSKYDFDVNIFANKYFSGGGHRKASGATSEYSFDKTCSYMEDCFRLELSNNEERA